MNEFDVLSDPAVVGGGVACGGSPCGRALCDCVAWSGERIKPSDYATLSKNMTASHLHRGMFHTFGIAEFLLAYDTNLSAEIVVFKTIRLQLGHEKLDCLRKYRFLSSA